MDFVFLKNFIVPSAFVIGGLLTGFIFEKFVLRKLKKVAHKTSWEWDEIIIVSMRGAVFLSFTFLGIYLAVKSYMGDSPHAEKIDKLIIVTMIFIGTVVISKIAVGFVQIYSQRVTGGFLSTSIFSNLTKILIFIIGTLTILDYLKISITPILTALGVGGLAVALGLQDTLANLFAGIHIIASKQIRPGDYVKLSSGEEGFVTDITWRYTNIKSLSNTITIIPNAQLAKTNVTNFDLPEKEMAVLVQVGVSYDSDLEKVEKVTAEVAREVMNGLEGGIPEFEPFIRYHTFDNSSINFTVILRGRQFTDKYLITHEFIKMLQRRYRQEGIEIPSPIRTLYFKDNIPLK